MKPIIKFLAEARTELLKVSWPTRNVALSLTMTVLAVSVAFAIYIAGVDFVMTEGIKWLTAISGKQTSSNSVNVGDIQTSPVN